MKSRGFLIYVVLPLALAILWGGVAVPYLLSQIDERIPDVAKMADDMLQEKAEANSGDAGLVIWSSVAAHVEALQCSPMDYTRVEHNAEETGTEFGLIIIRLDCGDDWVVPEVNADGLTDGELDFVIQSSRDLQTGEPNFVGLSVYGLHDQLNVVFQPHEVYTSVAETEG